MLVSQDFKNFIFCTTLLCLAVSIGVESRVDANHNFILGASRHIPVNHTENNSRPPSNITAGECASIDGRLVILPGPQGDPGLQGPRGVPGPPGIPGYPGMNGHNGPPGECTCVRGVKGEVGPPGLRGATGEEGPHGSLGVAGPEGPQGPAGAKGDPGLCTGNSGGSGPQGEQVVEEYLSPSASELWVTALHELLMKACRNFDSDILLGDFNQRSLNWDLSAAGGEGLPGQKGDPGVPGQDAICDASFCRARPDQSADVPSRPRSKTRSRRRRYSAFSVSRFGTAAAEQDTEIVTWDHEFVNVGGDFSSDTGVFNCSIPGFYFFTFNIYKSSTANYPLVRLMRNGDVQVSIIDADYWDSEDSSTNSVILDLDPGDTVWLELYQGRVLHSSFYRYTTFSGTLLHAR